MHTLTRPDSYANNRTPTNNWKSTFWLFGILTILFSPFLTYFYSMAINMVFPVLVSLNFLSSNWTKNFLFNSMYWKHPCTSLRGLLTIPTFYFSTPPLPPPQSLFCHHKSNLDLLLAQICLLLLLGIFVKMWDHGTWCVCREYVIA